MTEPPAALVDGRVEIRRAETADRTHLRALFDDYLKELNRYCGEAARATDAATYPWFDVYWREPGRHPYLIFLDGEIAGFSFVRDSRSNDAPVSQLSEFYIEPRYRRMGVGGIAARKIWSFFPGPWEFRVFALNTAAIAFWKSCMTAGSIENVAIRELSGPDGARIQFNFLTGDTAR